MSTEADPLESYLLDVESADVVQVAEQPAEMAGASPRPVAASERVASVDVLRGFALLGILAMNIVGFSWPGVVYDNPTRGAGFSGLNRAIWLFNHLFFEMKMMTIFSMLFGAGLVLMTDRTDARGGSLRGVYYRRVLWLLLIGLVHSYLIWWGDILVLYAECGLLLYLFRRRSARTLVILGVCVMSVLVPILAGFVGGLNYMKRTAEHVRAEVKAGRKPTPFESRIEHQWTRIEPQMSMKPDLEKRAKNFQEELAIHRGGYWGIVKHRAAQLWVIQTIVFLLAGLWMGGGRMLLGMGLMKYGVFDAQRPMRFYAWMSGLCYGIGLPIVAYDAYVRIEHDFSAIFLKLQGGMLYNYFASVLVALGHVGVIIMIYKAGWLTWLTRRLAAVGRMALSNYLTHSLICTTLFYGYGFGYFGTINRTGLAAIVVTIWVIQLIISPIWLERFRFGPAEWLWRSLTYRQRQPFRRAAEGAPV